MAKKGTPKTKSLGERIDELRDPEVFSKLFTRLTMDFVKARMHTGGKWKTTLSTQDLLMLARPELFAKIASADKLGEARRYEISDRFQGARVSCAVDLKRSKMFKRKLYAKPIPNIRFVFTTSRHPSAVAMYSTQDGLSFRYARGKKGGLELMGEKREQLKKHAFEALAHLFSHDKWKHLPPEHHENLNLVGNRIRRLMHV